MSIGSRNTDDTVSSENVHEYVNKSFYMAIPLTINESIMMNHITTAN